MMQCFSTRELTKKGKNYLIVGKITKQEERRKLVTLKSSRKEEKTNQRHKLNKTLRWINNLLTVDVLYCYFCMMYASSIIKKCRNKLYGCILPL